MVDVWSLKSAGSTGDLIVEFASRQAMVGACRLANGLGLPRVRFRVLTWGNEQFPVVYLH
jgi:hypothetical protein